MASRDLLATSVALGELEDELDLRDASLLECVVPRSGPAKTAQLPEGILVDEPPFGGIHPLDGPTMTA